MNTNTNNTNNYYETSYYSNMENSLNQLNCELDKSIEEIINNGNIEINPTYNLTNLNSNNVVGLDVSDENKILCIKKKKRCNYINCNHKLSNIDQISNICRCEFKFCNKHKIPECHNCKYDYKENGKRKIKLLNPKIKNEKFNKI